MIGFTAKIINCINAKRLEHQLMILWPDFEIKEWLNTYGPQRLNLLFDFHFIEQVTQVKTDLQNYLDHPSLLLDYTHVVVTQTEQEDGLNLILITRPIAIDRMLKFRNCWSLTIFHFSSKAYVWGAVMLPSKQNIHCAHRVVTPQSISQEENRLHIEIQLKLDEPKYETILIIGSLRKPMYERFYCTKEMPSNAFQLYQVKLAPLDSFCETQVREGQLPTLKVKEYRPSSFWIESKEIAVSASSKNTDRQKRQIEKKVASMSLSKPAKEERKQKNKMVQVIVEGRGRKSEKPARKSFAVHEKQADITGKEMVKVSWLSQPAKQISVRMATLMAWNPSLNEAMVKREDGETYLKLELQGVHIQVLAQRHLHLFRDILEGGPLDLESKDLLMLCKMLHSAGAESLFDQMYMMALQKVQVQSWVCLWLMSEGQPNESYYREELKEFLFNHSEPILNNIHFEIHLLEIFSDASVISQCLANVQNYGHLEDLLHICTKLSKCESVLEYTMMTWGQIEALQPLPSFKPKFKFQDSQEKVFVCGCESRFEPSDDSFHFKVDKTLSEPLLSREYAFEFDWMQPISQIFLPEIRLEDRRFIMHFSYSYNCLSCYLSYADARDQQTINGNFCPQFLSKYFMVRIDAEGEELLTEKFVCLFRTSQTESVRFHESKDIGLERGCKMRVQIDIADNCTYPLCLQYLCPSWKGIFTYHQKHQKQRLGELTFGKVNPRRNSEYLEKKNINLALDLKTEALFTLTEECFEHEGCSACTENQGLIAFIEMVPEPVFIHLVSCFELEAESESSLLLLVAHYYLHRESSSLKGELFYHLRYDYIPLKQLLELLLNKPRLRAIPGFMDVVHYQYKLKWLGVKGSGRRFTEMGRIKSREIQELDFEVELEAIEKDPHLSKLINNRLRP